jgi:hypothetical protein
VAAFHEHLPSPHKDLNPIMNTQQTSILRMYVNDMLAVEKAVHHAISGQTKDPHVAELPDVLQLLTEITGTTARRIRTFEDLSEKHSGKWGAAVKEAVATAAGILAGIYDKVRKHPVSRMLRDDHVALNLACVCYGMLYTTAVAFEEEEIATSALEAVNETAAQITRLTALIPGVVVKELSLEGPTNPEAAALAVEAIEGAWDEAAQKMESAHHLAAV